MYMQVCHAVHMFYPEHVLHGELMLLTLQCDHLPELKHMHIGATTALADTFQTWPMLVVAQNN